jgi:hypothetical protein
MLCGLVLQLWQLPAHARKKVKPTVVQDLHYGEVLFYFYQGDYFNALTRLLAARSRDQLPNHDEESELLLGGLYLSYGQHRLAGEIFERLLAQSVEPELRDRAWFFLAKVWYQRGYLDDAEAALGRIEDRLEKPLETERKMLAAQILMDQGRFEEARDRLAQWRRRDGDLAFAKYNLGVSLVRLDRIDEGAKLLDEVGGLQPVDEQTAGLRDKANVALGYAWLQADRPDMARPPLQRVRLEGPFSNKALLGVGWADASQEDYRSALVPWMALRRRNLLDPAVQESLLAVPYAMARLDANKQAADYYLDAIEAFYEEIARLDGSIQTIREGRLIDAVLAQDNSEQLGWYWQLKDLPDLAETRYLYELMSTHRFQEGLKNYRDLLLMQDNLNAWDESLVAFDDILATREQAYRDRLPEIQASLDEIDLDELAARRLDFASRLGAVERSGDVVALGTEKEQGIWEELVAMESKLELLGEDAQSAELRQKQKFLKGLLYWDLSRDYKARLWRDKKLLRTLDREIKEVQRRHVRTDEARRNWPDRLAGLTNRIGGLSPRLEAVRMAVDSAVERQRGMIETVAVQELTAQKARLDTYMVQARFALASIYDRAAESAGADFAGTGAGSQ